MKRTRLLAVLAIAIVAGLLVTGCKGPTDLAPDARTASHWLPESPENFAIWAGQHDSAGYVTVWATTSKTPDTLYIKYQTTGNWWLEETQAHVAESLNGIPQKNGNPSPGQFEFKNNWDPRATTCTYAKTLPPVEEDSSAELYIAAHCVVIELGDRGRVIQRQTGWSGPYDFPGHNWAKYIKYKRFIKDVNMPPTNDPCSMAVFRDHENVPPGYNAKARFKVALDGVPPGYDVWDMPPSQYYPDFWDAPPDSFWRGWCSEHAVTLTKSYPDEDPYWFKDVRLYSSQDPARPKRDLVYDDAWDNVNYLLNHKLDGATSDEIQVALWWLLTPIDPTLPPLEGNAKLMHDEAYDHGNGWHPSKGQWLAVLCDAPRDPLPPYKVPQLVFIEVDP